MIRALLWVAVFTLQAADLTLPIEKYKLKNGMRVILSQDNAAPVVATYLIYDIGARAEQKGRTGFAHLFEHMMFQGSTNAPKGLHFKMVESNGGWLNGSTHADYTDYYQVLPSTKLPVALWLEADRMRGLNITKENLDNQKEAVKQERRLRMDNQPYVLGLMERWPELFFRNWSSSHSLIGSFEDLNAASVADVAQFFKTYYAPNNAALVIVGDIQIPETKKLIEHYFADIPSQPQPKRPDLIEPPITEPRSAVHKDPLARVPGVIIGFQAPKRRSPDYYALTMLDTVLTGGDSSRFRQNLIKGKQSVISYESNLGWPFGGAADFVDPGAFAMFLMYKPGFTGKQIVEQVDQEMGAIQKSGVDAKELARAKTYFRYTRISGLQTSINRAQLLGQYEIFDGDPNLINTEIEKFMAITPQQIQEVARKYFSPKHRVTLEIVPGKKGGE